MSDSTLRSLERKYKETGAYADYCAWMCGLARSGARFEGGACAPSFRDTLEAVVVSRLRGECLDVSPLQTSTYLVYPMYRHRFKVVQGEVERDPVRGLYDRCVGAPFKHPTKVRGLRREEFGYCDNEWLHRGNASSIEYWRTAVRDENLLRLAREVLEEMKFITLPPSEDFFDTHNDTIHTLSLYEGNAVSLPI